MNTSSSTETQKGRHAHTAINVGRIERKASMIGGAALALTGINKLKNMKFVPAMAMMAAGGMLMYRGKTGHCDLYEAMGVVTAGTEDAGLVVEKVMTINRSPQQVYDFWHDFQNLPRFMQHLDMVQKTGTSTSHWKARGPGDISLEWDAEVTEDTPGQRISWRSLENADIPNRGTVEFHEAPAGRGTEILVRLQYFPVGGEVGKMAAKVAHGINSRQIEEDLRRLKQIMETGETPTACLVPECMTTH
jgi:uncharacterized membrane protein